MPPAASGSAGINQKFRIHFQAVVMARLHGSIVLQAIARRKALESLCRAVR